MIGAAEVSLDASTVEWHVVEGDRGGTVRYATEPVDGDYGAYRYRVVYTAPATAGTYHLRWQNAQKFNATATIDVKSP